MENNDNNELRKSTILNNLLCSINANHILCVFYSEDLVNILNEAKKNGFEFDIDAVDNLLDELDAFEKELEDIKSYTYCDDASIEHFFELNNKICSLNTSALALINIYLNEYSSNIIKSDNKELYNNIISTSDMINNVPNYGFKEIIESKNKSKR